MVLNEAAAERWKSLNRSSTFLAPAGLSAAPRLLPAASLPALPPSKRERSKLWELNDSVHCSIIGTRLTTCELQRAMGKVVQTDVSVFTDHDLHAQAVGLCNGPNAAAKILQKTLDRRHEAIIKRFSRLQREAAVLAAWAEARKEGDIPGAYWTVLTHPDVGHTGLRQAFGDVHMLSHLVGAANGGREDHPSLLPGLISQADRVAFPVDCVSHDAARTVKRICRQLGKAWVPLRPSGLASFLAAFAAQPNQEVSK
jgi:hypothetical protein